MRLVVSPFISLVTNSNYLTLLTGIFQQIRRNQTQQPSPLPKIINNNITLIDHISIRDKEEVDEEATKVAVKGIRVVAEARAIIISDIKIKINIKIITIILEPIIIRTISIIISTFSRKIRL